MRTSLPVIPGPNRTISVLMSKIESGQGIRTSIAQIVAEELDVPVTCVQVSSPDTDFALEGSSTTGSNSIQAFDLGRMRS